MPAETRDLTAAEFFVEIDNMYVRMNRIEKLAPEGVHSNVAHAVAAFGEVIAKMRTTRAWMMDYFDCVVKTDHRNCEAQLDMRGHDHQYDLIRDYLDE